MKTLTRASALRGRRLRLWGVFNGTAWVAERPLGWVAGCAIRLFVLALLASITITFVNTLPQTFVLANGGALQILFFGVTMLMLAWFAPMLASEVVQGQPHLSGSDGVRTAVGATFATAGGIVLARASMNMALSPVKSAIGAIGGRRGPRGSIGGRGNSGRPAQINYAKMNPKPTSSPKNSGSSKP